MDFGAGERVYMPPMDEDPYQIRAAGEQSRKLMVVAIMLVVLCALGAVAWNIYGRSGPAEVIAAEGPFKTLTPTPSASGEDTRDVYNLIEAARGGQAPATIAAAPAPPIAMSAPAAPEPPVAYSAPVAAGGYLVQLGALRTVEAADAAWMKIESTHPGLLRGVKKDVQRADLGAQGIYYRVRAGYFGDRGQALNFCERVKGAGLACMVVAR